MYFVIRNSDGDTRIRQMTAEELKKALKEENWGSDPDFIQPNSKYDSDTNYWGNALMIIKGEIIVPKPKQTVTEYEV